VYLGVVRVEIELVALNRFPNTVAVTVAELVLVVEPGLLVMVAEDVVVRVVDMVVAAGKH
jgi:hypothetical protein